MGLFLCHGTTRAVTLTARAVAVDGVAITPSADVLIDPGQTVTVEAECTAVNGRRVSFLVRAHDGIDVIGEGRHERIIVPWTRFVARVNEKAKLARAEAISHRIGG